MSSMNGYIFDIQRFSLHDGPGIRTTVFLKGCNLNCFWCHNPESINKEPEIQFFRHKCTGCGRCLRICPQNAIRRVGEELVFLRELCTKCGKCAEECFTGARIMVGKFVSTEEVMCEIEKDIPFYNASGGGVTISGGEPMLQIGFLKELLTRCREKHIHTAVDTAGHVPYKNFEEVIPSTDLFLYDLKVIDEQVHAQVTGTGNKLILKNLQRLSADFGNIVIRIPVVPGVNDNEINMRHTGEFLKKLDGIRKVELLPFHKMALGKYEGLGKEYKARNFGPVSKERLAFLRKILSEYNISVIVSD